MCTLHCWKPWTSDPEVWDATKLALMHVESLTSLRSDWSCPEGTDILLQTSSGHIQDLTSTRLGNFKTRLWTVPKRSEYSHSNWAKKSSCVCIKHFQVPTASQTGSDLYQIMWLQQNNFTASVVLQRDCWLFARSNETLYVTMYIIV